MQRITDQISKDTSCHLTPEMAEQLDPNKMFDEANICKAIASMRPHTAAGMDGLGIDFYKTHAKDLAPHLRQLFLEAHSNGHMSEAMRHAVVSLLHKGKNLPRDLDKNYRPISVTATEYRILGRCIHQHLAPFIRHLIGETQLGFVPGRRIDENILALTELANFCDSDDSRGGIFVMLDNAKAYDRVQWPFLQKVLEAFRFPPHFRSLIGMLFTDISSSLKVNGHIGAPFSVQNGLRQGCCVAPLLYLLVHECFLKMIRNDTTIKGIPIPTQEGEFNDSAHSEMRERAFADDTGVALASDASSNRLFEIADQYSLGSGSKLQIEKTVDGRHSFWIR